MTGLASEAPQERDERYSRHVLLPEVGPGGQERLGRASVLLVGAGGLGAPAALYLAAAGVGRLGLVDFDAVDRSNLQRQVLYSTEDVGKSKVESAKRRLNGLNPNVQVELFPERLTAQNARRIFAPFDLILDGSDNFPTRYLVNDACVLLKKAHVHGAVSRFEGQVSVFAAQDGPCYRCLYPDPPAPGSVPSCAEGGVLGVVPGIIGALQAAEALKLILGLGRPLAGRLLMLDALNMEWRTLALRRNPACPVCGDFPKITTLTDAEAPCAALPEVSVEDLKRRLDAREDFLLLDVREPQEHARGRIAGARLIPLGELSGRLAELEAWRGRPILVHCKSGGRSARAVALLRGRGFDAVNVAGGIAAWARRVDPSIAVD